MATLTLVDLTKRFGRSVVAVNKFNLEVPDGEFLVLLGPSGCGKTTTMRMVAGLEEVTDGSIYIGDRDVTDLAPRDRNVSMVFQNYAVWPHMSVFDNIAYALKLKKMSKQDIEQKLMSYSSDTLHSSLVANSNVSPSPERLLSNLKFSCLTNRSQTLMLS
jgi:multiple sugar transport system ATP-binding protein